MKTSKIIFILFVISIIFLAGCSNKEKQSAESEADIPGDSGYYNDIDGQLDDSDLNSLDEDTNIDWV